MLALPNLASIELLPERNTFLLPAVRSEIYDELKLLNHHYNYYISLRVKAKQSLTVLIDRTMPDIKTLLLNRSTEPDRDKLCDFIRKYWHYDNITKMSENAFVKNYNNWAKGKSINLAKVRLEKFILLHLIVSQPYPRHCHLLNC